MTRSVHTVDTRTNTRQHAGAHTDTKTGKEGVARRGGAVAVWKAEHAQHARGEHGMRAHAGHQQTHKKSRHTHAGAQRGRRKVAGERVAGVREGAGVGEGVVRQATRGGASQA